MNSRSAYLSIVSLSLVCFMIAFAVDGLDAQSEGVKPKAAELIVPIENDFQTLDPAQLSDPFTSRIVWQIYEGLIGLDSKGKPIPLLAQSWQASDNHSVWTFDIRPNVYFHQSESFGTGKRTRTVTAEDVRYSYQRFAKGFGSFVFSGLVKGLDDFISGRSSTVSGFAAPTDNQFVIRLTRPDPAFIYRITSPYLSIMPREVIEREGDEFGRTVAIGTGPYRLRNRTDTEVVLEANASYWRPVLGNLKSLTFRVDKNPQIRVAQFEKGVYGIIALPPALQSRFLAKGELLQKWESRYHFYRARTLNVHYLGIDNRRVPDVHLRRSIGMAVDKQGIVNGLLGGLASVAEELVPSGLQGFHAAPPLQFDPAAARQELAQSNYRGERMSLLVSDTPYHELIGQILQSQLQSVGIKIELQRVDLNTLLTRLFSANRPDLFLAFSEWVFSAPELILESYRSTRFPNPNLTEFRNSKVDELITQALSATDRSEINRLCEQVSKLAAAEVPVVPLYHMDAAFLLKNRYTGFNVNGHQYWDFSNVVAKGH